ncbi:hypothetical protein ACFQET_08575 [Levilactobacillus tangyuanensis]|uniref:Nuclear transport factor 2 family protein n=1 Tax=Levilactobacillus tangyuanensis TaxID=2486021 RepID=A0ABW1TQR4_9LACO|nr:hypothetical protein [Levilactobacillus tangyuanensis]
MPNADVKITDLDADAQQQALIDFAKFYIRHFRSNDLEILSQYKVDYAMNDINHYLYVNHSFSPAELATGVLAYKREMFLEILKTVDLAYNTDGSLKGNTWSAWYHQEYAAIAPGI